MVKFDDLPTKVLKKFVIFENTDERGNRLFIIKKRYRKGIKIIFTSENIPHKYQQNNSLEEAESSLRKYIINDLKIRPLEEGYHPDYSFLRVFRKFFRLINQKNL